MTHEPHERTVNAPQLTSETHEKSLEAKDERLQSIADFLFFISSIYKQFHFVCSRVKVLYGGNNALLCIFFLPAPTL